jgi:uroporphyrinogen decarboxylase
VTGRERILSALSHKEPDRVPVDLSGHPASGIAAAAYARLRKALGLPPKPVRVYDPVQQLAILDDDLLECFGVDTIEMGRAFSLDDKWWADWTLPDGTPCLMPVWAQPKRREGEWVLRSRSGNVLRRMPDGALYFEQCYWPWLECDDLEHIREVLDASTIATPPGPSVSSPAELSEGARRLRQSTDRAIIGLFGGNLFEHGNFLYRMDNFLMILAGEPWRAHEFLDKLVEVHLADLELFLGAVGPYIDVVEFGDDLGGQTGPLISPKMYREFFKPRHKLLWTHAKQLADVKVMLHCCGAVRPLLADLIDAGLDAINPVQVSGKDMDAAGLKRDFGKDLTFWGGGCDTQNVLPNGTPEAVRRHVFDQLTALARGGGFVFQQVHNILSNVPPSNVVAMYEMVREFSKESMAP